MDTLLSLRLLFVIHLLRPSMRNQLTAYLNSAITVLILVVVALIPLIFAPLTTEFFETPKIIFLVGAVLVLLLLTSFSWVLQGKVLITRTPFDLPLVLLLGVVVVSTFFSDTRYISILGNAPRIHGSAVAWVAYILFYFILTSNLKSIGQVRAVFYTLLTSATLVAAVSVLSYFGLFMPLSFAQAINFTPAGSSFSAAALLALLLPLLLLSIIRPSKSFPLPVSIALSTIFGVAIALVGDLASQVGSLVVVGLIIFITKRDQLKRVMPLLAIPVGISLLVFVLGMLPFGNANQLQQKRVNFPREIQLSFSDSWKVSASAFRDAPFFGPGPSSYLFNFTVYKPVEFNTSKFWNLRFDTAFNEYLQILGTLGLLGILGLIFLSAMVLNFGWKGLYHQDNTLSLALSISAIVAIVLLALHATTPVVMVAIFTILAMLMATHKSISGKVEELSIGIKASKLTDSNLIVGDILPIILFLPILIFVITIGWKTSKIVLADYHHRVALNAAGTRGIDTYNELVKAEALNPNVDLYRTDLAQTNFAIANAIAASKGPSQASPAGSLTDQDKQNIQQLLSQSINEARAATLLSPKNVANWEILASIYRQISGVAQNALQFSLDSYGRAIQRDPLNPLLRLNVGGVYYSVKNYDLAIRFFTDAVNLKPDFANGYYNLSVALRDKGDLQDAQVSAEQVMQLLDPQSPDYKTAGEYLADLKARIATGSASAQGTNVPPAAQENGALQNKNLPQVLDLPQPENIATPAAVKKNPAAQTPTATATPAPTATPNP